MRVKNSLVGVGAGVGHQPVAALGNALGDCDIARRGNDLDQHIRCGLDQPSGVGLVLLRDDQYVHGSLRFQVPEGHRGVGFMDDVGRDLTGDDLAEEAVGFGHGGTVRVPGSKVAGQVSDR